MSKQSAIKKHLKNKTLGCMGFSFHTKKNDRNTFIINIYVYFPKKKGMRNASESARMYLFFKALPVFSLVGATGSLLIFFIGRSRSFHRP
jgi:hypothetical protein